MFLKKIAVISCQARYWNEVDVTGSVDRKYGSRRKRKEEH